jgi:hypothetical protein
MHPTTASCTQVEMYDLQKESGKGWDLNVSLFERLILTPGFPHAMLGVQWRMHPDISRLIKHTYPALEDHPRVQEHPPVKGLPPSTHVLFIDHREPEEEEAERMRGRWSKGHAYQSKVNLYEVR